MAKKISRKAVAERYAEALFQSALDKGEEDPVRSELIEIVRLCAESAELKAVMTNPVLSAQTRMRALSAVADKMGLSATMRGFLETAAGYNRLDLIGEIAEAYEKKYDAHHGILTVRVVSAVPLSEKNAQKLVDVLTSFYQKEIRLDAVVNPDLIGGLTVQVGFVLIDLSVRAQLQKLYQTMKGADV